MTKGMAAPMLDDSCFTLPGDVTQYVLCVQMDDRGRIMDITMES